MTERALLTGEHVVLALLTIRPMHGYEMACYLEDEGIATVCPIEQGTLYTYLRNVEARGYVGFAEERVGQRPPRKVYHLSPQGRDLIEPWLRQPVDRIREVRLEFLVKLFFLREVDRDAHRAILGEQIRVCEEYLRALARREPDNAFARLVMQSKWSAADATLGWLKQYAYEVQLEEQQS